MSRSGPLVSIVITNYNYDRFLPEAIDSALAQTHPRIEIVVVDDGSTDGSRKVIARYGDRVKPVLKHNGGMASAMNAGAEAATGETVVFLDADDSLVPSAAATIAPLVRVGVAKIHWPLMEVDGRGKPQGRLVPPQRLDRGNVVARLADEGPNAYLSPPTSGNAWARGCLDRILPIPEREFATHSDTYLNAVAPVYGDVEAVDEPLAYYRIHGRNDFGNLPAAARVQRNLDMYDARCRALAEHLRRRGIQASTRRWKRGNRHYDWMQSVTRSIGLVESVVPTGSTFVLIDEHQWSGDWGESEVVQDRHAVRIPARNGQYAGHPNDDEEAIDALERADSEGADFVVIAEPAFWWLEHYEGFRQHLESRYSRVCDNSAVAIFRRR